MRPRSPGPLRQTLDDLLASAPDAVARAKALARALGPRISDAEIDDTIARLADAWETDEARLGIDAFLTKRPPPWVRTP